MIIQGDCREILRTGPAESIQCCVTSPPYWGLRDYGCDGQLGLEATPEEYVANMVEVFREVWRVLRPDGVLWLNLGDSYARQGGRTEGVSRHWDGRERDPGGMHAKRSLASDFGAKPKDLAGIPWRVAFALQADGWYLRQDIIWHKPNPMPESVRDRCTKAHEYLFLLTKEPRYYFDSEAIKEPAITGREAKYDNGRNGHGGGESHEGQGSSTRKFGSDPAKRNRRSVWTITTKPFKEAHFATFPPDLVRPCILAGSRPGDTVLDPFAGAGTTGLVSDELGRAFVGIELNPEYVEIANKRRG